MKIKIAIVLILLAGSVLTSCEQSTATVPFILPPGPDPVTVLEEQVESERQLRKDAEAKIDEEETIRGHWQLATLGLAVVTVISFFGGTAIGSRGRHHASATS